MVIAEATDTFVLVAGKVLGNVISPFLFPLIQNNAFDGWAKSHPLAEPSNGWRSTGWAILGLAAFMVVAVGAALGISSKDQPKNIEVRYAMPTDVNAGEAVAITIDLANSADHPQLLYSLEFDTHFLKGISIDQSTPAFETTKPNALAPIKTYIFEHSIPANGKLKIELQGRAVSPGSYPFTLSVCVKTAMACNPYNLPTISVH